MLGKCLCGEVAFEITGELSNFYQCHCSECRKVTGSASNTGFLVATADFHWRHGEQHVTQFVKDSGYNSCFCSHCGSALPNPVKSGEHYWVPAGSLEEETHRKIAAHLHIGSKASWAAISDTGKQFAEMPDLATLIKILELGAWKG
ncbi:MAG: GFA family protein [Chromatiales bacterium]|nr:GFA family protein [Chromatiales bacterium]